MRYGTLMKSLAVALAAGAVISMIPPSPVRAKVDRLIGKSVVVDVQIFGRPFTLEGIVEDVFSR